MTGSKNLLAVSAQHFDIYGHLATTVKVILYQQRLFVYCDFDLSPQGKHSTNWGSIAFRWAKWTTRGCGTETIKLKGTILTFINVM